MDRAAFGATALGLAITRKKTQQALTEYHLLGPCGCAHLGFQTAPGDLQLRYVLLSLQQAALQPLLL